MKLSSDTQPHDHPYLDPLALLQKSVKLPEVVTGGRAPTTNAMGYIFYELTPVAKEFISQEAKTGKSLFEVGCGFSNIPIAALKQEVTTYIASDLAEEHLALLVRRIQEIFGTDTHQKLSRLKFLQAKAPQELPTYNQEFDAIIIDKVLHFLTPEEIDAVIIWLQTSLKSRGKIYINLTSPNNRLYTDKARAIYQEKSRKGLAYPGYFPNSYDYINPEELKENTNLLLPKSILLFTIADFCKLLEAYGFEICQTYPLYLVKSERPYWAEVPVGEEEFSGVIARYKN